MIQPLADIKTNLVTGFLGVGKTTTIRHLLSSRPPQEPWAVLVNEFGAVGIDGRVIEAQPGLTVRELPGGCLCCTTGVPLQVALVQLLRLARPRRLLIEPTGLGHPARVLALLKGEHFRKVLDLRATVCLIDPRRLDDPRLLAAETFRDQVALADVLVANKADLASPAQLQRFRDWALALYPPKLTVAEAVGGRLSPQWLEPPAQPRQAHFPDFHAAHGSCEPLAAARPAVGRPVRLDSQGLGRHGAGWVFAAEEVFDAECLRARLQAEPGVERLKGVFRTDDGWLLFNRVGAEMTVAPAGAGDDSRLEVLTTGERDWLRLEQALLACRGV